jgi:hypothetical protein
MHENVEHDALRPPAPRRGNYARGKVQNLSMPVSATGHIFVSRRPYDQGRPE